MLILGFDGTHIDAESQVSHWLSEEDLGGVLLFDYDVINQRQGKNLDTQEQIQELIQHIKQFGKHPIIAVDYEGGAVDRLRYVEASVLTKTPEIMAQLSETERKKEFAKMADYLCQLGFNLNFAPVVDLHLEEKEGIIGKLGRSFSADPEKMAEIAGEFIEIFAQKRIASCYKHFPGHGSATGDTHHGFVDVTETFANKELIPYTFTSGSAQPAMVMTAHVINRNLDPSGLPATLSYPVLTGLLRRELGFKGIIVSDDLQMQAIAHHYSLEESLRLTINAGADMLIFANQLATITAPEVINVVEALVKSGAILESRIEEAYGRVIALKQVLYADVSPNR